jgi:hypothetical protein
MPTPLTPADSQRLERSWIDEHLTKIFNLYRVSSAEGRELVGRTDNADYAGIVFPIYRPGESKPCEYILRRDHPPIENGKPKGKYLLPPGRRNRAMFAPGESVEALTDTTVPALILEGVKKTMAGHRLNHYKCDHPRFLVFGINGVHGYRSTIGKVVNSAGKRVDEKGMLPDFDRITWAGRVVVVIFDSDCATNEKVAAARRGLVYELRKRGAVVKVLDLPALDELEITGLDDFLARRGPEEALELIQEAMMSHPPEPPPSGVFTPMSLAQLLDEPEPLEPEWTLEDILATESLAAIVSKPKVGKSTLVYEFGVAVTQGRTFLGRATKRGNVLILAVEENRRDVKRRLRNLGVDQLDAMHLHIGVLTDTPDTIYALAGFIKQHNIVLVIFDTLNSFWSVSDENDAGAVTQAIKPLLQLARDSSATILLIHHSRKAEGEYGDEIRGSGALFSLLDTALILKRHTVDTQRRLSIISRYSESPPELLLELREHGYESLGDPAASSKAAKLAKMADALTSTPAEAKALAAKAGLPMKSAYTLLDLLRQRERAVRSGTGKKGDPFLFSKFVSVSVPMTGGPEETNSPQPIPSAKEFPIGEEFVASDPSTIGVETETNYPDTWSEGADSFLPTPVPPGSNESEPEEVLTDEA